MSETLDVRARFTAIDEMSPVVQKLVTNLKKFEAIAKSIHASFAGIGRAGVASMAQFDRVAQNAAAQMRGLGNANKATARGFADDWRKATEQRIRDARSMYQSLERMESQYQRQLDRRIAAERRTERSSGRLGFGSTGRIPAPRMTTLMIGGAAIGTTAGSAIKRRIEVEAAEVRAQMFGDLSKAEVDALRKSFADRAGIRFGIGTSKALDAATEGLKAGVQKQFAGEFAELALKAQAGLDIPSADVAKLLGRLSTQMPWSKDRFGKILNAVAVANNATAADGSEIVHAMRRSLSALATTKMTPEQLAALDSTAISLGLQPQKSGTFVSFLTSQIAGADSAHGQLAKDLNGAGNALGFGGRTGMAAMMRSDPIKAIQQILDNLAKMPEKLRAKVAKQLGGREWMDELLTLVLGRDKLREVLRDVESNQGFLDKTALQKIRSMQGRWASIQAAFGLVWEKIGAGFETMFDQITDAVIGIADKFDFDSVRQHFAALIDGFREGFGLKDWGEVVKSIADQFDAGSIKRWKDFAKGFASGIREIFAGLKTAFNVVSFLVGGSSDAEGIGRFTAKLTGLAVALAIINPVLALFASIVTAFAAFNPFTRLVLGLIALAVGIKRVLDYVSDKIFSVFVHIVDAIKSAALSVINRVRSWIGLGPIGGGGGASGSWEDGGSVQKQSLLGPSQGVAGSFRKASFNTTVPDFSGGASGGIVNRGNIPSFSGGGGSASSLDKAAFDRKFSDTALAGKYDQIVAAANAEGVPPSLLAAVIAHETGNGKVLTANNPGGVMDPATGMSRKMQFTDLDSGIRKTAQTVAKNYRKAGGDIDRMGAIYAPTGAANDPRRLNGGWPSGVRSQMKALSGSDIAGSAGSGDAVAIGEKYLGMNEYSDAKVLAAYLGADVRGRSNAWCARFVNKSIEQAGGKGTGSAVANSFQRWGSAVDPSDVKRNDVLLQTHGLGYNQSGGHVGLATGETRMMNGRLQVKMLAGNDGDSVREHWIDVDRNLMVRRGNLPKGITGQVPAADAVKSVPPTVTPGTGAADTRMVHHGNVAIHINGGSHNPETLATLVQRRIDESMNWRIHDSESEYT